VDRVDFLCGDFSWKALFHLAPRPLYRLSSASVGARRCAAALSGRAARVR
jgi:hypothetical protein